DKSRGLQAMADHFGFDMSETMAFGDGSNDIGMLKAAGIGVAMGNAAPEVKAAADYVTTNDSDHGIVNALRHFGLLD
ncbi:MAG: HAD hydrolase family protein, partial [Muribaculaceae bacterium]|nr:HAD hydrolase family protein [Muribaculaceae bacterium]